MSKPSDAKDNRVRELARVRDMLADAASFASTADAVLVEVAAKGVKHALQWTKGTRVTDQRLVRDYARVLDVSTHGKRTPLTLALRAFGQALDNFARTDYAAAQSDLAMTERLLKP